MTIHSLTAYYDHPSASEPYKNCYAYDDPTLGIVAEPLVHSTSAVITSSLASCNYGSVDEPHPVVCIHFSTSFEEMKDAGFVEAQLPLIRLDHLKEEEEGSTYKARAIAPFHLDAKSSFDQEVWLCAHLLDYFADPPSTFYAFLLPVNEEKK